MPVTHDRSGGWMRRACAAAGAVVLAAAVLAPAPPAAAEERQEVVWADCPDLEPYEDAAPECATVEAPLDHARPGGRTVRIALARVPARGTAEGTLLVNPGGPGNAGRAWAARTAARLPDDLRDRYDVIGFDPRGTGASTPAAACDPDYFAPVRPDSVPRSRADEAELVDRAADYAAACGERNGDLLDHLTTVDSARDIETVRAALGVERIDFLGYSYGTYLGAVYATLHPDRVRRLVLDSIVHPGRPWWGSNLEQSRSIDAAARRFFAWTARHDGVYRLGATADEVARSYARARDGLRDAPADGTVGPTEFESVYALAAYTSAIWPELAAALSDHLVDGDPAALVAAYELRGESAESDPGRAVYLGVQCTDARWPRAWPTWHRAGERLHAEAPFIAWHNIWFNAPCAFWPSAGGRWFEVDGSAVADALFVQAEHDGATPAEGAYALRERFPNARLVVEEGGLRHGVALLGNACVDTAVADYLRDGTLPGAGGGPRGADHGCPAGPLPEPAGEREPARAPVPLPPGLGG
jgi:pimeloyl-ACP methyl ester carboxylesterase